MDIGYSEKVVRLYVDGFDETNLCSENNLISDLQHNPSWHMFAFPKLKVFVGDQVFGLRACKN
jgi:hypothetical protein